MSFQYKGKNIRLSRALIAPVGSPPEREPCSLECKLSGTTGTTGTVTFDIGHSWHLDLHNQTSNHKGLQYVFQLGATKRPWRQIRASLLMRSMACGSRQTMSGSTGSVTSILGNQRDRYLPATSKGASYHVHSWNMFHSRQTHINNKHNILNVSKLCYAYDIFWEELC